MNKDDLAAKERLAAYMYGALARAHYEELPDNEGIYAEIEGFQGVWANAPTFDSCREELASALEDWIAIHIAEGLELPDLPGLTAPVAA